MRGSGGLLNVVDVEATCWDGTPPVGAVSEIIEIGLTVVDLDAGSGSSGTVCSYGPCGPRSVTSVPS